MIALLLLLALAPAAKPKPVVPPTIGQQTCPTGVCYVCGQAIPLSVVTIRHGGAG